MKDQGMSPEMQELSDQIGEFIHYWGFKRIHGKIWTHLFLAKAPLDAADLVRQMKISKALVSISLRELLEYDVIQDVGKSPRGTRLYRTNPDILTVILSVLRQREKRMLSRIQAAHETFERLPENEKERMGVSDRHIEQLGALVARATVGLESIIALQSIDFGDWRNDFLTVDLTEEAELRQKSVIDSTSRERPRQAIHQGEPSTKVNTAPLAHEVPAQNNETLPLPAGGGLRFT
jgi:DNA-binding transcriptional regulator GbsR (MarR family)